MGRLASVPAFYALRVASALLLLKLSASALPVGGFGVFTQLMLFSALVNLAVVAGAQTGVIRQTAAVDDPERLAHTQTAAFVLWSAAAPLAVAASLLFAGPLARVLTGDPRYGLTVVGLALIGAAGGPGQIWCSLLSGRGRAPASLAAQALGLLAGVGGAAVLVWRGQPAAAAIAFAAGSLLTTAAAAALAAPWRTGFARLGEVRTEIAALLRYSTAFAATSGFAAATLFGLRFLYREAFGAQDLGYWLAANRVSDVSTQLIGLFMVQAFVPRLASAADPLVRRRLVLGAWGGAVAIMASVLIVFSLAAEPLVRLFLSPAFLPAIPAIRTYMAGDLLRVWPTIAMYTAFARGRPGRYAGIEIAVIAAMAAVTTVLIRLGEVGAPWFGYVAAYGAAALAVTGIFVWRSWIDRSPAAARTALTA